MPTELNPNPGKLVSIGVNEFSSSNYIWGTGHVTHLVLDKLSPDNTYIAIFGPHQLTVLDLMLKDSRIKIIYQAQRAVNRRPGHGTYPRNTLVVWEFSPDTAQNASA